MKILAAICWVFSAINIIITEDYGMCSNRDGALECAWEYWNKKFNVKE